MILFQVRAKVSEIRVRAIGVPGGYCRESNCILTDVDVGVRVAVEFTRNARGAMENKQHISVTDFNVG